MKKNNLLAGLAIGIALAGMMWGADYLADGGDSARTGWLRGESILSPANVGNTKLLWKVKLDSKVRSMTNLFPPVVATHVTTSKGPRDIAIVPAASDDLFALDTNTGDVLWRKHFDDGSGQESSGSWICAGGQTAVPVIGPSDTPGKFTIYSVSGDGLLHQLNVADGEDMTPPQKFLPPNGKPYALNLFNNVIYTPTGQGCGGVPNALYTFDLKTNVASELSPGGGGMWGRRGVAIAPDGTAYIGTGDGEYDPENGHLGNAIVAIKAGAEGLKLTGYYGPSNAAWLYKRDLDINVTPVAFDYKGKHFLVEGSKECRLWLLDRDNFGGDDHRTPLDRTPLICNDESNYQQQGSWGGMAAWQDAKGVQWVVMPFYGPVSKAFHAPLEYGRPEHGGAAAFRVEEQAGKWKLVPAWLSRDMDMADEPLVANGIVFTFGSGEDTTQRYVDRAWDDKSPAPNRIANSTHATVFALDAATGRELWSSGHQIASWNHNSGLSVANGHVYIDTFDGEVYCFGLK